MYRHILTLTLLWLHTAGYAQADYTINWPKQYKPENSRFFVHNEIFIAAPAPVIWNLLLDAEQWPAWYTGATNVQYTDTTINKLANNVSFTWNTMNLHFVSTIQEFVPQQTLCWQSEKRSINGYHAWLIIPADGGCRVITDESQRGWLTFFEKVFQPRKLQRLHDVWLLSLKQQAEAKYTQSVTK